MGRDLGHGNRDDSAAGSKDADQHSDVGEGHKLGCQHASRRVAIEDQKMGSNTGCQHRDMTKERPYGTTHALPSAAPQNLA